MQRNSTGRRETMKEDARLLRKHVVTLSEISAITPRKTNGFCLVVEIRLVFCSPYLHDNTWLTNSHNTSTAKIMHAKMMAG